MVDVWGEVVPNWIAAGAAALAVVFAGIAGKWAKKAAQSTAAQAEETRNEVRIAEQQLAVARSESERAKSDTELTRRITLESRFDVLAPTVYGLATLRDPVMITKADYQIHGPLEFRAEPDQEWIPVAILRREFESDELPHLEFRATVDVVIKNVSDTIAVIGMESQSSGGECDWAAGSTRAIEPRGETKVSWSRTWTREQVMSADSIDDPANRIFKHDILVWDIGNRIEDRYRFLAELAFFQRDGSLLIATREPRSGWGQGTVAIHVRRTYVGLDAQN